MSSCLKHLSFVCEFALLVASASVNAAPQGFLEGRLKIISLGEVELADGTPSKSTGANYADYPLIILARDSNKEIARATADKNGKYRIALSPGDYILDVHGRQPKGHVRAKPQRFTVVSNQITRVDMDIDTGIR
jgi:hypothetical protein